MILDPITLSVIQASLQQICDEMDLTFTRAAFLVNEILAMLSLLECIVCVFDCSDRHSNVGQERQQVGLFFQPLVH